MQAAELVSLRAALGAGAAAAADAAALRRDLDSRLAASEARLAALEEAVRVDGGRGVGALAAGSARELAGITERLGGAASRAELEAAVAGARRAGAEALEAVARDKARGRGPGGGGTRDARRRPARGSSRGWRRRRGRRRRSSRLCRAS